MELPPKRSQLFSNRRLVSSDSSDSSDMQLSVRRLVTVAFRGLRATFYMLFSQSVTLKVQRFVLEGAPNMSREAPNSYLI